MNLAPAASPCTPRFILLGHTTLFVIQLSLCSVSAQEESGTQTSANFTSGYLVQQGSEVERGFC